MGADGSDAHADEQEADTSQSRMPCLTASRSSFLRFPPLLKVKQNWSEPGSGARPCRAVQDDGSPGRQIRGRSASESAKCWHERRTRVNRYIWPNRHIARTGRARGQAARGLPRPSLSSTLGPAGSSRCGSKPVSDAEARHPRQLRRVNMDRVLAAAMGHPGPLTCAAITAATRPVGPHGREPLGRAPGLGLLQRARARPVHGGRPPRVVAVQRAATGWWPASCSMRPRLGSRRRPGRRDARRDRGRRHRPTRRPRAAASPG